MGRSKRGYDLILSQLKHKDRAMKMTNWPILGPLGAKLIDEKHMTLTYIPINQDLEQPENTAAPVSIIEHFIEMAEHHVYLRRCPCRSELDCKDFPQDLGCIFIGSASREVEPEVGHHVTKDEALAHLHKAVDMGLIPCLGRFKGDAIMLGVKDHAHLMTICLCCPCCCLSTSFKYASPRTKETLVKLEGLKVEVDDECNGCGLCEKACIFDQIRIVNGKATVLDGCKGCGRCMTACKRGNIKVTIDNPSFIDECIARITGKVDVT